MTAPQLAHTYDWGRMYSRIRGGTPEVPSITTVLDVLDQDMEWWEALCAVRLAMEHADRLADIKQMFSGPEKWNRERAAKDWLVGAAERDRDEASERGGLVHNYAEVYCLLQLGQATPDDLAHHRTLCEDAGVADYLTHFHDFWDTWKPTVLQPEATVWNSTVGYAGTTDLICEIDVEGHPVVAVMDWKCTTDDTPILMADGTEKRAADVAEGDLVLAWDTEANEFSPRPVSWVGDNGYQKTVTITADGGRELQVTLNHPVLVRRHNKPAGVRGRKMLDPEWVLAKDVRPGDLVLSAVRNETEDAVTTAGDEDMLGVEDAYLLGALVGDGATGRRTYRFSNESPDVVERVEKALVSWGLALGQSPSMAAYDYYLRDPLVDGTNGGRATAVTAFREWVRSHGLDGCGSGTKRVPPAVFSATRAARIAFIEGYLDTDGFVRDPAKFVPHISWSSDSEGVVRDFSRLLATVGVQSNVVAQLRKEGVVYIGSVSLPYAAVRLAQQIESLVPLREERLAILRAREVARKDDYGWIRVKDVHRHKVLTHTVAIEVDDLHTHVTAGIVSHNTKKALFKKNGQRKDTDLRDFTGMQLAAAALAEEIWLPGATPEEDKWMPFPYEVEVACGVAFAPDGYVVRQYAIHNPLTWRTFRALRAAWDFRRDGKSLMSDLLEGPNQIRRMPTRVAV